MKRRLVNELSIYLSGSSGREGTENYRFDTLCVSEKEKGEREL